MGPLDHKNIPHSSFHILKESLKTAPTLDLTTLYSTFTIEHGGCMYSPSWPRAKSTSSGFLILTTQSHRLRLASPPTSRSYCTLSDYKSSNNHWAFAVRADTPPIAYRVLSPHHISLIYFSVLILQLYALYRNLYSTCCLG